VQVVTEPEFLDWRQHPITGAFFKALFNDREYLKEMLVGGTDDDSNVRGRIAAVSMILSLDYEGLMESLRENK
jgi:hypothetical protein